MIRPDKLRVFSGRANPALAEKIVAILGDTLGRVSLADFPDGETMVKIEEDVRGGDVFLVQPTCPPVNQHLMELLIMLDCFKRASAARMTVVLPYYGYARQDRKDTGRVPITAKLVADLIARAGASRVLTLDQGGSLARLTAAQQRMEAKVPERDGRHRRSTEISPLSLPAMP